MSEIVVHNTLITIGGYEENPRLERALSAWDESRHEVSFAAFRKVAMPDGSETMVVPRCYPLKWLREMYPGHDVLYADRDLTACRRVESACLHEPRDDLQREALEWLDGRQKFSQHVLELRTGMGKTYIALKYACDYGYATLVVVHNTNVLEQWLARIEELTDVDREEVGVIQGYRSLDECQEEPGLKFYVAIHRTLAGALERNSRRLMDFCRATEVGMKVIDEAHIEMYDTCRIDLHTDVPVSLYLTATAERTDWRENRLYGFLLPVYYAWGGGSAKVREEEKYHKVYAVEYSTGTPETVQVTMHTKHGFDLNMWAENSLSHGELLISMLMRYVTKFDEPGFTHCAVTKTLAQCSLVRNGLLASGIPEEEIGMFNSLGPKDKETRRRELLKRFVVTTDKSLGTAIDTDVDVVYNFVPISSRPVILQLMGRLRSHRAGIFVDFWDSSIEACAEMWKKRRAPMKKVAERFVKWKYKGE